MAKTADVQKAIWTDPWFLALPPDAKLLYLWAISTEHGNLAGLFVCAQPVIQMETGLTPARFEKALDGLEGKLHYRPESGAVWVVGRAKNVRNKTKQIAKGMANAVVECPEPDFQIGFMQKYGEGKWLQEPLEQVALPSHLLEHHPNLAEVPSRSRSRSRGKEAEEEGSSTVLPARAAPTIGGKAITDEEAAIADRALAAFNEAVGGGAFELETWQGRIVRRVREKRHLTADQHVAIIRANFRQPWWSGRPSPAVIYGSREQFESAIETGREIRAQSSITGGLKAPSPLAADLAGDAA